ncbi:hypothetical protein [Pseudomonas urmiensis]|uniref:hypothetical protein n=1 Tax=Pseudomonas urmiensis TaxID=2745493 RepID=UPI003C96B589
MAQQTSTVESTTGLLPQPDVPAALELQADEAGAATLPLTALNSTLPVNVVAWNGYEQEYERIVNEEEITDPVMIFRVLWNSTEVAQSRRAMTASAAAFFPVALEVPQHLLKPEGISSLAYSAEVEFLGNRNLSSPLLLRVDRTAPNSRNPAVFHATNVATIDDTYLANNGQQAIFILDRWGDIRLQDRVQLFIIPDNQGGTPVVPTVEVPVTSLPAVGGSFQVPVPAALLRSGSFRVVARLIDRAGNVGPESLSHRVTIQLMGAAALPAPVVPLAADNLINLEEARRPVVVQIPQIAQAVAGNSIQIYWNERALGSLPVRADQQWPISVNVPWATIVADGFVGPVARPVRYELEQNGALINSPQIQVNIDFRVAGPDPQGPTELNTLLNPVIVGSRRDNAITPMDINQPVPVQVRLYDNPRVGDLLELHWGNLARVVARYRVTGNETPGQMVDFTPVPYDVITEAGDGLAIQVFYRIFINVNNVRGVNGQRANPTPVRVDTARLQRLTLPRSLTPPLATNVGLVNCATKPWDGFTLTVPGRQTNVQAGDRAQLRWQMFRTLNDGTSSSAQPAPVPLMLAPEYLPAVDINLDRATNGQPLEMSASEFTRLIVKVFEAAGGPFRGYARIGYRLTKPDGRSAESQLSWLEVNLQRPVTGVVCTSDVT